MKKFFYLLIIFLFIGCSEKIEPIIIYHNAGILGHFSSHQENKIGLPVLKSFFDKKAENKEDFLFFDSGKFFSNTREGRLAKMEGTFTLLKDIPYKAITLSAEDFIFGFADVKEGLSKIKYPVIISNLTSFDGSAISKIKKQLVFDYKGIKIGVLGVLSKADFDKLPRTIGLKATSEIETLKPMIAKMQEEGVNFIILLSSLGFEREDKTLSDKNLAEELTGINLILGINEENAKSKQESISHIYLSYPKQELKEIDKLKLFFNQDTKQIISFSKDEINLDKREYGYDENLADLIKKQQEQASKYDTKVITTLPKSLMQENTLGIYIANCLKSWGKTDIGFINLDALMADLPQGNLTEGQLYKALPFDDKVMFMKMRGDDLLQALQESIDNQKHFYLKGLEIFYSDAEKKKIGKIKVGGYNIQNDKLYSLSLPDHIISGGLGHDAFLNMFEFKNTDRPVREIVKWCLSRKVVPVK